MTVCCAWLTPNASFVIADSAITIEGDLQGQVPKPKTSFGEPTFVASDRVVVEAGVKVVQVSADSVVGVAGLIVPAMDALRIMRYRLLAGSSIPEAIEAIRERSSQGFQLLVIGHEHGAPRLWHVADGRAEERVVPGTILIIGSAEPEHKQWLARMIENAFSSGPRNMLAASIAAAQVRGQNKNAMSAGVGGAFYGAYVADSRANLSADMLFAFIDAAKLSTLDSVRIVLSGWREGVAFSRTISQTGGADESPGTHSGHWSWFASGVPLTDLQQMDATYQRAKAERTEPEYVTLVDNVSSSYVLVIARIRPDLIRVLIDVSAVEFALKGQLLQIAQALFAEAQRLDTIGFCHIGDDFPPREIEPGGVWKLVSNADEAKG